MYFEFVRGDLIELDFTRRDFFGNPVDITADTITAEVWLRNFRAAFAVTKANALLGQCRITALPAATLLWPVAILDCRVKFDRGSANSKQSELIRINMKLGL